MINNTLTYISLFSSARVGCYGFKQEGFECVATNEIIYRRLEVQRINKKSKFDSDYINRETEFGRIFTKVINLLAFKLKKNKKLKELGFLKTPLH